MKLQEDIKSAWLIHLKGFLFLLLGLIAGVYLWLESPTLRTVLMLSICVWGFCRFYYYLFYVLERYLGREKKFSGIFDALQHVLFSHRNAPGDKPQE